ncbi:helix-turn-helix domain-containing protein [Tenacibaculum xiamenense]|uniref:helix-turn-helix domain-containing protein n=1 Tax=Tenacibaculum xiamenense TaxID=1261553 RepID=UPI003895F39B
MLSNSLKVNRKANFIFGLFLFLWATFFLDEILVLIKAPPLKAIPALIFAFFQFLTPILFYISVVFFTNPNYKLKKQDLICFLLPTIYLVILIVDFENKSSLSFLLVPLLISHALIYTTLSYLKIRKHQRQINLFSSNTSEIDLGWLKSIIWAVIFTSITIAVFNSVYFGLPLNLYLNIIMLSIAFFIAYHALRQKEIFPKNKKHREEVILIEKEEKKLDIIKRKLIGDEDLVLLKSKLNSLMKEKELYLNHEVNLASLSEEMELSTHQLSYIINKGFNQNFFQFINTYRVQKAKELLADTSSDKLSILGIAYESGFSSKTTFNTTFKKLTNQTPSEFKKLRSNL